MPAGVSKFLTNSDPPRPPNPLGSVVVSSEDGGRSNALQCDRKKRSSVARAVEPPPHERTGGNHQRSVALVNYQHVGLCSSDSKAPVPIAHPHQWTAPFFETVARCNPCCSLKLSLPLRPPGHTINALYGDSSRRQMYYVDRKSTRLNSSHLVISYAVF